MKNYEVIETDKGYLLYKELETSELSTESPYLLEKIRDLKAQFLGVNYVTYRCGLKLFALKRVLFSEFPPFTLLQNTTIVRVLFILQPPAFHSASWPQSSSATASTNPTTAR
jgi:hypothetical protein